MEGPFTIIRNKWQITPLERIENAIEEVKKEIQIKKSEKNIEEIKELLKTIKVLEKERANRKKRVREMKTERQELINQLSHLRNKKISSERNNKMEGIWNKINEIDNDLGPYRNHDQTFYLG